MRKILLFCLLLGVIFSFTEAPVWAADNGTVVRESSPVTLDEAVVSAKRDAAAKSQDGVTTGSCHLNVTPGDWVRTSSSAELLADVPGVSLQKNGGVTSLPYLDGLGDDRVRIKVDGMDMISACANHMNSPLSYIDPTNVGSINVVAGITPVSMGGDSIAGSIIVNSAAPEFAKPGEGPLLKLQTGGYYRSNGNAFGANLSTSAATDFISIRYSGSVAESDDYKAAKDFKASGNAATDRGWLDGDVVGSSRYQAYNHAVDLALKKGDHMLQLNVGIQEIPYQGFANQRMDMTENFSQHYNLRYTGKFQWGDLEARVYDELTRHKMDFANDKQFSYGSSSTFIAPGMPMNTRGNNAGALLKADFDLSDQHILKVGLEAQRYRLDDWWPPSPSVLPAGYTSGGMAPNTFWNINNGKRDRIDVFTEWDAHWDKQWFSEIGVRSDTVMMNTGNIQGYNTGSMYNGSPLYPADTFNNANRQRTDYNVDVTALTRYTPTSMTDFEAGFARKTRSPNLYERYAWSTNTMAMEMVNFAGDGNYYVGNLDLKPEVANTISGTAYLHDTDPEQWGFKVTPFYTYLAHYIDAQRCPTSVCGTSTAVKSSLTATTGFVYLQFVNQSANLYGIDISSHYLIVKSADYGSVTATGAVNYVRGKNKTTGDNLYNIMPLNAKLALVYGIGGLKTTIEGQFVDAKTQVSQVRNEVPTPAYDLLNLRASYEWKMLRLDAGIENVLNKFYYMPLGGAYVGQGATMSSSSIPWGVAVPGYGRSYYIGMTAKF
ncbi:TonB-dependent receptor plug domain-containing protein [Candidatus Magnetominusculus dajiuhuensis]|uniref:TonB-dependent receptor plug domain-containing protein n=1 Tax=Candidatus Magnetominusculus dajiuhuensis TaxID=3137712 RepID=UPI003B437F9D